MQSLVCWKVNEWIMISKILLKGNGNILYAIIFILNIILPVTCIEMSVVKSSFRMNFIPFSRQRKYRHGPSLSPLWVTDLSKLSCVIYIFHLNVLLSTWTFRCSWKLLKFPVRKASWEHFLVPKCVYTRDCGLWLYFDIMLKWIGAQSNSHLPVLTPQYSTTPEGAVYYFS